MDVSHIVLTGLTLLGTALLVLYKIVKKLTAAYSNVKRSDCDLRSICCSSSCHTKNKDHKERDETIVSSSEPDD